MFYFLQEREVIRGSSWKGYQGGVREDIIPWAVDENSIHLTMDRGVACYSM
jgi:hypothetical protein